MQLFDKRINLDLKLERVIGLAIGYDSWGKSEIRTRQYQLLILCFVIELQTRTTIKEEVVKKDLYKKKKTFMAKFVGCLSLLAFTATGISLYSAYDALTSANANALTIMSVVYLVLGLVLGMFYLAMDPKEKYKYV